MRCTIFILAICGLGTGSVHATQLGYDPHWRVGDSWKVRFTVMERSMRDGPPSPPVPVERVYTYRVLTTHQVLTPVALGEAPNAEPPRSVKIVKIGVHPDSGIGSAWLLTFNRRKKTLMRVDEIIPDSEGIEHVSPFVNDAWMADLNEYWLTMIHDFPKIPKTLRDETRVVVPIAGSSLSEFTQAVTFGAGQVTVVMTRPDPVTTLQHQTGFVCRAGEKWWTSAEVRLGNEVQISAVLQE